jgi:DNA polymerase III alpha subunit
MAMITIQDREASIDGVVFSSVFAREAAHLADGAIVLLVGRVDHSRGDAQIIVDQVVPIDQAARQLAARLELSFFDEDDGGNDIESRMQMAAGVLQQAGASQVGGSGRAVDVLINLHTQGKRIALKPNRLHVICEPTLIQRLGDLIGPEHVSVIGGGVPARANGNGNGNGGPWRRSG